MIRTLVARTLAVAALLPGTLIAAAPVAAGTAASKEIQAKVTNDILTARMVTDFVVARPPTVVSKKTIKPQPAPVPSTPIPSARDRKIAKIVAYAKRQVGKWYHYGSAGPNTFDCSGLVVAAYRQAGIALPHQTLALHYRGRVVSRSQLRPGDYVFLRPQNGTRGHVGLYIGNGRIIEAPHTGARVRISRLNVFYGARRIL